MWRGAIFYKGVSPCVGRAPRENRTLERSRRSGFGCSWRASAHRGRMSRQREAGHLGELVAVEPQRIHVAVDEVPDIKKTPSGLNAMSSAETAHFGMADLFSYRS